MEGYIEREYYVVQVTGGVVFCGGRFQVERVFCGGRLQGESVFRGGRLQGE